MGDRAGDVIDLVSVWVIVPRSRSHPISSPRRRAVWSLVHRLDSRHVIYVLLQPRRRAKTRFLKLYCSVEGKDQVRARLRDWDLGCWTRRSPARCSRRLSVAGSRRRWNRTAVGIGFLFDI